MALRGTGGAAGMGWGWWGVSHGLEVMPGVKSVPGIWTHTYPRKEQPVLVLLQH